MFSLRRFNTYMYTGRKPARSFGTVIGCWACTSFHFPAFFGRTRTYEQTFLCLSVLMKSTTQLNCVWCCKLLTSFLFGAINFSQLVLEHYGPSKIEVIAPCRLQTAISYFQVKFRIFNCCCMHFFGEISDSFSSVKLLFSSGERRY